MSTTRLEEKCLPSNARSASYTMGELKSPRRRKYACSECTTRSSAVADAFLHDGTGGGVLQELPLLGDQVMLNGECGERGFVKAAQAELFLAGIGVDVADGEDSRDAGLVFLGIHLERALFQCHPPFRDGAQLRMQPVEREYLIGGQLYLPAVGRVDVEPRQPV